MEKFQFHYAVAYSAPVECKNWGNNRQLEKNYKLIFGEKKNRIIATNVSSIIYQGLTLACPHAEECVLSSLYTELSLCNHECSPVML